MRLTKRDKRKLAKAARELAGEYAEGRGPELNPGSWCGCAAGQVFIRAGVSNEASRTEWSTPAEVLDYRFGSILTDATNRQTADGAWSGHPPVPGAVVFPLLALADELEAQS